MLNTLIEVLKTLVTILGIIIVCNVIINIIVQPFKKKKQKEAVDKFVKELDKIAKDCIEELKKQEEKTIKNTKKSKEN